MADSLLSNLSERRAALHLGTLAAGHGSISVHPMQPADAAYLGEHFAAMDPWARYPLRPDVLERYLSAQESGAPRYAIFRDGAIAGALGLRLNWLRGPYIQFLGLVADQQGHGIGRHILARIDSDTKASGGANLWVAASEFNAKALAFYERHGFARTARLDDVLQDGIAEILLRKRL